MKYILSLFIALWSIAAWGQEGGDGFNPSNPGEPGQRYDLTVTTPRRGRQYLTFGETAIRFGRICLPQPPMPTTTSLSVGHRTEIRFPAAVLSIIPCRQKILP